MPPFDIVTILGPTASGKTMLAANLAYKINGEIISADSRQVYKHMDLGTGKDYRDYIINGLQVPYHLIDVVEPGYKYNVYEYRSDFMKAINSITSRGKFPVLCGGTGMYIEAVLKEYKLMHVPIDDNLRGELDKKSKEELTLMLSSYKKLHNTSDITSRNRLIRAIEIEKYYREHQGKDSSYSRLRNLYIGVNIDRNARRERISTRLKERLKNGLIEEVEKLLNNGVPVDTLIYYGLEYKFITQYIQRKLSYDELFTNLNTAIYQFAKRQMTWFRRMERNGDKIHWVDYDLPLEEKTEIIISLLKLGCI